MKKTKSKLPKVSIIIPLYVIEKRFFKDLLKFKKLNYRNYEILVVSDTNVKKQLPKKSKVRFIHTKLKRTGPAEKRDIALRYAKGEICAFIDDDAYPDPKWLENAIVHFSHPHIAGVGGPGLTPKEDSYWEQITGLVYSSFFCGGHAQHRFVKGEPRFVKDYPAYNLLIRKSVLEQVGGYGSHFYGGEDTFLCLKIVKKGYKIIYDPEVVVYHHRRALFTPYLNQIANIGLHRGFFAKKYPETSRQFSYFIPSILTIGFFGCLILSFFISYIRFAFLGGVFVFLILGIVSVIKKTNVEKAFLASLGIIATHLVYGVNFLKGLTKKELLR